VSEGVQIFVKGSSFVPTKFGKIMKNRSSFRHPYGYDSLTGQAFYGNFLDKSFLSFFEELAPSGAKSPFFEGFNHSCRSAFG
jgi:hypothetical protein